MKNMKKEKIIRNSAKCLKCNTEIVSEYTHDYVSCPCGSLSVDGGKEYLKRSYKSINDFIDTSIVMSDSENVICS